MDGLAAMQHPVPLSLLLHRLPSILPDRGPLTLFNISLSLSPRQLDTARWRALIKLFRTWAVMRTHRDTDGTGDSPRTLLEGRSRAAAPGVFVTISL